MRRTRWARKAKKRSSSFSTNETKCQSVAESMFITRTKSHRLIRLPEVRLKTGKSSSGIYAAIQNREFPAPVAIGIRARAWVSSEVDKWIADRVAESRDDHHGTR